MQKLEQENLSQIYRMSEEVDLETRQIYLIGGGDGNAEVRNNMIYYSIFWFHKYDNSDKNIFVKPCPQSPSPKSQIQGWADNKILWYCMVLLPHFFW